MAPGPHTTYKKRQRELARLEKRREKAARRLQRRQEKRSPSPGNTSDQSPARSAPA